MPDLRRIHLRRSRMMEKDGGETLFCVMTYRGEPAPALGFLTPGQFPEFDGEDAWFEVRWFNKHRREFVRRLEAPATAASQTRPAIALLDSADPDHGSA